MEASKKKAVKKKKLKSIERKKKRVTTPKNKEIKMEKTMKQMQKVLKTYGEEVVRKLSEKYKFDYEEAAEYVLKDEETKTRGRPEKKVKRVVNKDKDDAEAMIETLIAEVVAEKITKVASTEVASTEVAVATTEKTEVVEKKKRAPAKKKTEVAVATTEVVAAAVEKTEAPSEVAAEKKKVTKKKTEVAVATTEVAPAEKKKVTKKKTEVAVATTEVFVLAEVPAEKKKATKAKVASAEEVPAEKKKVTTTKTKVVEKAKMVEDVITKGLLNVPVEEPAVVMVGQFAMKKKAEAKVEVPLLAVPKVVAPPAPAVKKAAPAELEEDEIDEEAEEEFDCDEIIYEGKTYLLSKDNVIYDADNIEEPTALGTWDGKKIIFNSEDEE